MSDSPRIRIGNQTAFSAPPLVPFEYAVAAAFDAFEFFPDRHNSGEGWGEKDISGESRLWIRDTARRHDIRLSVHAPWPSSPLKPASGNELDRTVEFAREIGAELLNIHLYADYGAEAYLEGIIAFAGHLADLGIDTSIENIPDTTPEDFNRLFALLGNGQACGIRRIGMCFDLGHANLCRETRNEYLRFFDELDPHVPVTHIHLHENYGDLDAHLPLFTGPSGKDTAGISGLMERMNKRRFSGSIILEQWPHPPSLLLNARERLFEMLRSAGKTASAVQAYLSGD
jgi:sugar phosphate isomerase/epimerase